MGLLSAMCKEWLSFPLPLLKIIQGRRPICKGHGLLSFQKSFSLPDFFIFLSIRRESASKVQVLRGVRRGRCAGSRIIRAVIPQFPQPLLKTLLKVWKTVFHAVFSTISTGFSTIGGKPFHITVWIIPCVKTATFQFLRGFPRYFLQNFQVFPPARHAGGGARPPARKVHLIPVKTVAICRPAPYNKSDVSIAAPFSGGRRRTAD